jgi:hypothetical protein
VSGLGQGRYSPAPIPKVFTSIVPAPSRLPAAASVVPRSDLPEALELATHLADAGCHLLVAAGQPLNQSIVLSLGRQAGGERAVKC